MVKIMVKRKAKKKPVPYWNGEQYVTPGSSEEQEMGYRIARSSSGMGNDDIPPIVYLLVLMVIVGIAIIAITLWPITILVLVIAMCYYGCKFIAWCILKVRECLVGDWNGKR